MEILGQALYASHIFIGIITLCHSVLVQNNQTNSTTDPGDLKSILQSAISGNAAAVFDASLSAHEGLVASLPVGVPLLDMTRSTWSVPDVNFTMDRDVPNSIALQGTALAALDSTNTLRNIANKNNKFLRHISVQNKTGIPNMKSTVMKTHPERTAEPSGTILKLSQKSNITKSGLFIPMEKLSRVRRQANVSTSAKRNNTARVLFLLNPNSKTNISAVQRKLDGRVLMLVKQPNVSNVQVNTSPEPVISVEPRNNLHELLHLGLIRSRLNNSLREAKQSLPAIQMINNLNKIDLPLIPSNITTRNISHNFSKKDSEANSSIQLPSDQIGTGKQLLQNSNNLNSSQLKMIQAHSHPQSRISTLSNKPSTDTQSRSEQNTSRQTAVTSNMKQLRTSQPRHVVSLQEQNLGRWARLPLVLRQPVSINRISTHPVGRSRSRSSATIPRVSRPLVRTLSSRNLNQRRPTRRTLAPVVTQRRGRPGIQRRRPSTRRQIMRRRPAPPDPFTARFSAGFQRGSNLLHQPPLELTSFDGSSNTGFNTLTPAQTGLLPLNSPPGLFGGIGMPGLFSGPIMI